MPAWAAPGGAQRNGGERRRESVAICIVQASLGNPESIYAARQDKLAASCKSCKTSCKSKKWQHRRSRRHQHMRNKQRSDSERNKIRAQRSTKQKSSSVSGESGARKSEGDGAMGNPYLYHSWKSEGDGAHGKSLPGSAMEIRGRWRAWEILSGPHMEIPGRWLWRAWEILFPNSHGNPRAMAPMRNPSPYLDQLWKSEGDGAHAKSLSRSSMEIRRRWRAWEILIGIGHGNPRAMARMGNPYPDQIWR